MGQEIKRKKISQLIIAVMIGSRTGTSVMMKKIIYLQLQKQRSDKI